MEDVYNQVARYELCKRRLAEEGTIRVLGGSFRLISENQKLILEFLDKKEDDFRDIYGRIQGSELRKNRVNTKKRYNFTKNR